MPVDPWAVLDAIYAQLCGGYAACSCPETRRRIDHVLAAIERAQKEKEKAEDAG